MTDSKVSALPQITPPFYGTETIYIIDHSGVSSKAVLSDIMGIGIRAVVNNGAANFAQFSILANDGAGGMQLATNNSTQALAQAVAISLGALAMTHTGNVQFNGYVPGLSGLTPGPVWLGTAGGITSVPPTTPGSYQTLVGYAISSTELILAPGFPIGPF